MKIVCKLGSDVYCLSVHVGCVISIMKVCFSMCSVQKSHNIKCSRTIMPNVNASLLFRASVVHLYHRTVSTRTVMVIEEGVGA